MAVVAWYLMRAGAEYCLTGPRPFGVIKVWLRLLVWLVDDGVWCGGVFDGVLHI